MAWRSGRCYHEGYAELKVTVYGHGGMRGGTGRCSLEGYAELQVTVYWGHGLCVAVLGSVCWEYRGRAAVLGSRTVGVTRSRMAVLGCPLDPSNNSGGLQGHPLAPLTN